MVDSRAKGARGEYLVRDMLREYTGLKFERVPSSGALEYLKGDLYVPHEKNHYCIEVKNYSESPLNDRMFTAEKTNNLIRWWKKLLMQAENRDQKPLLFFKYNRSKVFVVTEHKPKFCKYMFISWLNCYVLLAEDWLKLEQIELIENGV
jgi:Holliday junction resolvase